MSKLQTASAKSKTRAASSAKRSYTRKEHDFNKRTRKQILAFAKVNGLVAAAAEFNTSYYDVRAICDEFGYAPKLGRRFAA